MLVLWVFPGYLSTTPDCPLHLYEWNQAYCAESESVNALPAGPGGPYIGCDSGFVFQGVRFSLYLSFDGRPGDLGFVQGWVSTSTAACQSMGLVGNPLGPPVINWTSPDRSVYLLWEEPFESPAGSGWVANITCGVYLGP